VEIRNLACCPETQPTWWWGNSQPGVAEKPRHVRERYWLTLLLIQLDDTPRVAAGHFIIIIFYDLFQNN
jgi:hypothetical protein